MDVSSCERERSLVQAAVQLAKQKEILVEQHVGGYRKERKGKTNAANGMMLVFIPSFQRIRRSLQRKKISEESGVSAKSLE